MANDEERKLNREKLAAWFLAHPGASVDASLKAATKEGRALGLTMNIAAAVKRDADVERANREAERRRLALLNPPPVPRVQKHCDRCGSDEHYISECPVIPGAPPLPLPTFEV